MVLLIEAALVVALHLAGAVTGVVPLGSLGSWLTTADPTTVLVAVARMAGLAIGYWLVASTILYAVSYHLGLGSMTRALQWVTLPVIRRLVQGTLALSLTGASMIGPSLVVAAPAMAQQAAAAGTGTTQPGGQDGTGTSLYAPDAAGWPQQPDSSGFWLPSGLNPSAPTGQVPANQGATSASESYTVVRGDNFWKISKARLRQAVGRDVTDDEVAHYWVRVVAANRATIRSHNPNLIYPNEQVKLPPVFNDE